MKKRSIKNDRTDEEGKGSNSVDRGSMSKSRTIYGDNRHLYEHLKSSEDLQG